MAGLGVVAAAALAAGIVISAGLPGSSKGAGTPGKTSGSATVQRRDLVQTDTESGTLSYANSQTVYNRMTGTVTWLPTIGQVMTPGQTLYKVDNGPVILFKGDLPAYRSLSEGVTDGPDVKELEQNLRDLGYDPNHDMTIDDTFDCGDRGGGRSLAGRAGRDPDRHGHARSGRVPAGPSADHRG